MIKQCKICDSDFKTYNSKLQTCSRECANKLISINTRKALRASLRYNPENKQIQLKNAWQIRHIEIDKKFSELFKTYPLQENWRYDSNAHKVIITFNCSQCGKEKTVEKIFTRYIRFVTESKNHFCSSECHSLHNYRNRNSANYKTKLESTVEEYLNSITKDYKYTGDGSFKIASRTPDFVNVNGQKKLIEVNGCYHHKCPACYPKKNLNIRIAQDNQKLVDYKSFGWTPLTIWEHEVLDDSFKDKVRNFI